jgi:glycosyltransferase involved in cell wall biosynthesis
MVKIQLFGDYFGTSGYVQHTKGLVNGLLDEGIDVALSPNSRPQGWEMSLSDRELKAVNNNPVDSDYIMLVTLPHIAPFFFSYNKPILQWCVWEGSDIPHAWVDILKDDRIKYILVPSQHNKDAITNVCRDLEYKIRIIHHGVDLNVFKPIEVETDNTFKFLIDKGWPNGSKDRGGVSFAIKAFAEEFKTNEEVELYVKLNTAYGLTEQIMNNNMSELKINNKTPGRIRFVVDNLNNEQLNELYNKCDAGLITSMAEAFNFAGLQALACNKPLVTTTYGGQTEYANEKNSWLLTKGDFIVPCWDILYEDTKWKRPDINEIRKTLRAVYNRRNSIEFKEKKDASRNSILQFTWNNTAKDIIKLL